MPLTDLFQEAERQLVVCNACRYCEGYCAVFPAMELRQAFKDGDITYLANLCHDCRACYYACMYSPPHEFGVNIPKVLSEVRQASYRRYGWPPAFARLVQSVPATVLVIAAAVIVVLGAAVLLAGPGRLLGVHLGPGAFYQVVAYWAILVPGIAALCYWLGVWTAGGVWFWREIRGGAPERLTVAAVGGAVWDALTLRWLRGGGPGCPYPGERASRGRGVLHAFVFYGFLAAIASTTLAAIYQDVFDLMPPYPLTSAPVVFGTLGGVAIIVGAGGMLLVKVRSDRAPAAGAALGMDYVFVITLGLASLTGMLTLALRATPVMGLILMIHLGIVAALFVTAPYGKFVHLVYRFLALVRYRLERESEP
ncbi:MAG TPA: tricarballylate utilization 4Fe-4S protein TcuB [bacterium]|nr:tricarballylate utilization 4Fe-4S protein TcuB [bacterium]